MLIVRTEVRTSVSNTTENHFNFLVAQPLVKQEIESISKFTQQALMRYKGKKRIPQKI